MGERDSVPRVDPDSGESWWRSDESHGPRSPRPTVDDWWTGPPPAAAAAPPQEPHREPSLDALSQPPTPEASRSPPVDRPRTVAVSGKPRPWLLLVVGAVAVVLAALAVVGLVQWRSTSSDFRDAEAIASGAQATATDLRAELQDAVDATAAATERADELEGRLADVQAAFPIAVGSITADAGLPVGRVSFEVTPSATSCNGTCPDGYQPFELVLELTRAGDGYVASVVTSRVADQVSDDLQIGFEDGAWTTSAPIDAWECSSTGAPLDASASLAIWVSGIDIADGQLVYSYAGMYQETIPKTSCNRGLSLEWDVAASP